MTQEVSDSKIHFRCSKCQTKYSALPEQSGKKGTCKNCGAPIKVPKTDSAFSKAGDVVKTLGGLLLGITIFVVGIFLVVFLIKGGVWLSLKTLPWLSTIMWFVFIFDIFFLLPLSMLKKRKGFSSIGFVISSYVYGITLWLWGLLLTYVLWGGVAVVIGLFIAGIGVVPMAMIATALKTQWSVTGQLILPTIFTYGSRIYGFHLAEKADEIAYEAAYS